MRFGILRNSQNDVVSGCWSCGFWLWVECCDGESSCLWIRSCGLSVFREGFFENYALCGLVFLAICTWCDLWVFELWSLCVGVECLDGDSLNWVMLSSLRSVRLACWLKCLGASLSRAIFSWMAICRSWRPGLGIAQCHTTFSSGVMLNVIGAGSGFGMWDKKVGRHFAWWVIVARWPVKLQIQPSDYFQCKA